MAQHDNGAPPRRTQGRVGIQGYANPDAQEMFDDRLETPLSIFELE